MVCGFQGVWQKGCDILVLIRRGVLQELPFRKGQSICYVCQVARKMATIFHSDANPVDHSPNPVFAILIRLLKFSSVPSCFSVISIEEVGTSGLFKIVNFGKQFIDATHDDLVGRCHGDCEDNDGLTSFNPSRRTCR